MWNLHVYNKLFWKERIFFNNKNSALKGDWMLTLLISYRKKITANECNTFDDTEQSGYEDHYFFGIYSKSKTFKKNSGCFKILVLSLFFWVPVS